MFILFISFRSHLHIFSQTNLPSVSLKKQNQFCFNSHRNIIACSFVTSRISLVSTLLGMEIAWILQTKIMTGHTFSFKMRPYPNVPTFVHHQITKA